MSIGFIELHSFTKRLPRYFEDSKYAEVQRTLLEHPDDGDVMPGCNGLRKLRVADQRRKKGKRGGQRIIYLYLPEFATIFFVDIYSKEEKEDVSADDKKLFRLLVRQFKADAATRRPNHRKDQK